MASRSLSRELALLVLGQVSDRNQQPSDQGDLSLESLLDKALDGLNQHWRETLDASADDLDKAQQALLACDAEDGHGNGSTNSMAFAHIGSTLFALKYV